MATAFGVFLVVAPGPALFSLAVFLVVFLLSRIVSLASILAAASFPLIAWFMSPWTHNYLILVILCMVSGLILVKHHQNIQRLLQGTGW